MAKKRSIQRSTGKKRSKPRLRFNFGVLLLIFGLSFAGCFGLYMLAANTNENFFSEEFEKGNVIDEQPATQPVSDSADTSDAESEPASDAAPAITNPVPQSDAADVSYFDSACLITDSTLLGIKDCTEFTDVYGNVQLGAAGINTVKLESNYGTVTAYEMLKLKKPLNVYVMLGSDIASVPADDMITEYTTFITNLKSSLPDMKIYVMQLPPAPADSSVSNETINDYNTKLLSMANVCGVYCIDTNTALKGVDGTLSGEYWSADTVSLTAQAYEEICGYIRTHTA